eukprot:407363-Prymnesium_polylepis.3
MHAARSSSDPSVRQLTQTRTQPSLCTRVHSQICPARGPAHAKTVMRSPTVGRYVPPDVM